MKEKITGVVKKIFKTRFAVAFTIGIVIRLILAPFTEHRYDMYIWRLQQAFVYCYHLNPTNLPAYAPAVYNWSYTPLWLFVLLLIYPLFAFFFPPHYPSNIELLWEKANFGKPGENFGEGYQSFVGDRVYLPFLDMIIKMPLIISDILVALLLMKIVNKLTEKRIAHKIALLWLLNPYVIFISSIWGMFDSLPALFTLLAVWLFLKNKYDKSALTFGIASLFKIYPIVLVPLLTLILYKKTKSAFSSLKYFLIPTCMTFLVTFISFAGFASFAGQEPIATARTLTLQLFIGRGSPDWYGQNIFTGLTPLGMLTSVFKFLDVKSNLPVSIVLMSLAIIIILTKIHRKRDFSETDVIAYVVIGHLAIYLTYSVVNEQYIIWVLPFLLLLSANRKDLKLEYFYWTISLLAMSFTFAHYQDMSYFISPYFVLGYPGYLPISASFGLTAAVLYLIGIKFVLKKEE